MSRNVRTLISVATGTPAALLFVMSMLFCLTGEGETAKITLGLSAVFGLLSLATSPAEQ